MNDNLTKHDSIKGQIRGFDLFYHMNTNYLNKNKVI